MFTEPKRLQMMEVGSDLVDCQDKLCDVASLMEIFVRYGEDELSKLRTMLKEVATKYHTWEILMNELRTVENRANIYRALLRSIPGNVCVTLHDANESTGFMYLDLFADIPQRLNKQREELLGKSVLTVDPAIGEPRMHALRRCLASGQKERYNYHHDWEGRRWYFTVDVVPLYGTEEIITIVQDNEPTQLGWWLERYTPIAR